MKPIMNLSTLSFFAFVVVFFQPCCHGMILKPSLQCQGGLDFGLDAGHQSFDCLLLVWCDHVDGECADVVATVESRGCAKHL